MSGPGRFPWAVFVCGPLGTVVRWRSRPCGGGRHSRRRGDRSCGSCAPGTAGRGCRARRSARRRGGPRRPCGSRAPARRRPGSHGRSPGHTLRSPSEPRSGRGAGCAVSRRRSTSSAIRPCVGTGGTISARSASVRSACRSSCGRPYCNHAASVRVMISSIVGVQTPDRAPQPEAKRDFRNRLLEDRPGA